MVNETDFPTRGKVTRILEDAVFFAPAGTTYELQLRTPGGRYAGEAGELIDCVIRSAARKVWTVPSGGAFVTPIQGQPKIVQGRVKHIDSKYLVLATAGANVLVKLPENAAGIDLATGPIRIGALVNAPLLPGSTMELLGAAVPA